MPYLTPDMNPADPMISRVLSLPLSLMKIAAGALWDLTEPYNYEPYGDLTPEQVADMMLDAVIEWYMSTDDRIGTIIMFATEDPPDGTLVCDGTLYERSAYPALVERLSSSLLVDDTYFRVPDLTDRVPRGTADALGVGAMGGADSVTLTVGQLPAHTHAVHSHGLAINIEEPLPGAPYPLSTPDILPGTTGSTGSGDPVPTLPRYTGVRFAIWYR